MQVNGVRKLGIILILCFAMLCTSLSESTIVSYAAGITETVNYTDEETGLAYTLTMNGSDAAAALIDGTSFVGGKLPDTVMYEGLEYTITKIGIKAFYNYPGSITGFPAGTAQISNQAFKGCTGLTAAELPDSITKILSGAFSGCSNLALKKLPSGLTSIQASAFRDCTSLALTSLPDGVKSLEQMAFSGCTGLELTSLPDGVITIGDSAFSGCTNLALEELPDSVQTIGKSAFSKCSNLELSALPKGVTALGDFAFSGCTKITISELPEGLTGIGQKAFYNCTSLKEMIIPEGVTTIGFEAFRGCVNLTTVQLPDSLTTIDSQVFQECSRLELSSLPPNVTSVGHQAFYGCNSITYMALGDNITSFSDQCFENQPDLLVSDGTATKTALNEAIASKPSLGTIVFPWTGTQEELNAGEVSYVRGEQNITGDLILAGGKKLVVTGSGKMTIAGNLTIESGAEVMIDAGGILVVEGIVTNYGMITNKGIITNNGTLDNQNIIQSVIGSIEGNEVSGNDAMISNVAVTSYTGYYDMTPHEGIAEITGLLEGDVVSYSNTYASNYLEHPQLVTWSEKCPEYTTVQDADTPVTVKVERMKNGAWCTAALITAKVVIQKASLEIVELPTASPITEGDALQKSELTGGKAVIKGTDIEMTIGTFQWGSIECDKVPKLEDSQSTLYNIYYNAVTETGYSVDIVRGYIPVTVMECFHENTVHELQNVRETTCAKAGYTGDICCMQCGDVLEAGTEIPSLEHSWDGGTITEMPTTEKTGVRTYTCTVCSETKTETIPMIEKPIEDNSETESSETGESGTEENGTESSETGGNGTESSEKDDTNHTTVNKHPAAVPVIRENPKGGTYEYKEEAVLKVTAESTDGGVLAYQWYRNDKNSTSGAEAVDGANAVSLTVSTDKIGTTYYFCRVTNTNYHTTGVETAAADSAIAEIHVVKAANPITKVSKYSKPIGSKLKLKPAGSATYKVKNCKVAAVTKKGKVTFKNFGTTTLTVKAKGNQYYKSATKKITITVTPKTASIKKLKSSKAGSFTVSWKKDAKATGYQIQYAANNKFKGAKSVTVKSNKTTSATINKLKANKTYYVRIREYKKVGKKKIYGSWSKTKSIPR